MPADQLTFDGVDSREFGIRDPLERCYSPGFLGRNCIRRLVGTNFAAFPKGTWVEPSVGGGAFAASLQRIKPTGAQIIGVDIDPEAVGFRMCDEHLVGDWLDVAKTPKLRFDLQGRGRLPVTVVVGNPPFSVSHEHVLAVREHFPDAILGFVMPLAYLGVKRWQAILRDHPLAELHPIIGRPWPKKVRETAFYVWRPGHRGPYRCYEGVSW